MARFSKKAQEKLESIGWYPGRKAEELMNLWEKKLVEEEGFVSFPAAHDALLEFGGLKYTMKSDLDKRITHVIFDINPLWLSGKQEEFVEYRKFFGEWFFPLGEVWDKSAYLMISESGKIYDLTVDDIGLEGKSIEEFFEVWLGGKNIEQIVIPLATILPDFENET